jgi:hypothetical protein
MRIFKLSDMIGRLYTVTARGRMEAIDIITKKTGLYVFVVD